MAWDGAAHLTEGSSHLQRAAPFPRVVDAGKGKEELCTPGTEPWIVALDGGCSLSRVDDSATLMGISSPWSRPRLVLGGTRMRGARQYGRKQQMLEEGCVSTSSGSKGRRLGGTLAAQLPRAACGPRDLAADEEALRLSGPSCRRRADATQLCFSIVGVCALAM